MIKVNLEWAMAPSYELRKMQMSYAAVPRMGDQLVLDTKWHSGPNLYTIRCVRWDTWGVPTLFLGGLGLLAEVDG